MSSELQCCQAVTSGSEEKATINFFDFFKGHEPATAQPTSGAASSQIRTIFPSFVYFYDICSAGYCRLCESRCDNNDNNHSLQSEVLRLLRVQTVGHRAARQPRRHDPATHPPPVRWVAKYWCLRWSPDTTKATSVAQPAPNRLHPAPGVCQPPPSIRKRGTL